MKNNCDSLLNMKKSELLELLATLNDENLTLRDSLNLDKNITFGVELEFEYSKNEEIKKYLENNWIIKRDASLKRGGEVNSPILTDNIETWKELDSVCNLISMYAKIGNHAGGHIHLGSQILGPNIRDWYKFLMLWAAYENVIFRFCYGNYLGARKTITYYAKPVGLLFKEHIQSEATSLNQFLENFRSRYQAVNFNKITGTKFKENNTIEFRCPNATLQSEVWQNNINFLSKLILYSRSSDYDYDKVLKRFNEINELTCNISYYSEIFLEQSLELCDMIFDNNLDKMYFLKQYLKAFEIGKYDYSKEKVKKL